MLQLKHSHLTLYGNCSCSCSWHVASPLVREQAREQALPQANHQQDLSR